MLSDETLSENLLALFNSMKKKPMSEKDYADKLAKIIDDQIKTAEVQAGIAVSASGSMGQVAGQTVASGSLQ